MLLEVLLQLLLLPEGVSEEGIDLDDILEVVDAQGGEVGVQQLKEGKAQPLGDGGRCRSGRCGRGLGSSRRSYQGRHCSRCARTCRYNRCLRRCCLDLGPRC